MRCEQGGRGVWSFEIWIERERGNEFYWGSLGRTIHLNKEGGFSFIKLGFYPKEEVS